MDQNINKLLKALCPDDPEEAGRRYLRLHQKLEAFFRFRGVADPAAAADEALDRAARRIAEGVEVPDIDKFCLGIARFIVKEGWRLNSRESAAFIEFLERLKLTNDDQTDRYNLMKTCFERLSEYDQALLNSYCSGPSGRERGKYRLELAEELNFTVTALRVRVTRLRRGLDDCVKELSKSQW